MKRKVMFVGGLPSELHGVVSFSQFGQIAELDEELAADAARGGSVIVPAEHPAAQAFTPKELVDFSSFGSHDYAPPSFREKLKAARIAAAAFAAQEDAQPGKPQFVPDQPAQEDLNG
jgi:hypothetical protein